MTKYEQLEARVSQLESNINMGESTLEAKFAEMEKKFLAIDQAIHNWMDQSANRQPVAESPPARAPT